jgi:hypothetical protein
VPEAVVDQLEVVQVGEEQCHRTAVAALRVERGGQPLVEQRAVGQAGERIVVRLMA